MSIAVWPIGAYLLGSIPTSYLAARFGAGIDLREHGSKNLGATNVYRVLGWRFAIPVGVFDVAKGFAPAILAPADPAWMPLVAGTAAVVGHVFPLYLGFRGGKGVATAAGVVLALAPLALAASAVIWVVTVLLSRFVSLASVLGAAAFPAAERLIEPDDDYTFVAGLVLALFIVYTHRSNIRRLLSGTENRIGRRHAEGSA